MTFSTEHSPVVALDLVSELAPRYLWWAPVGTSDHAFERALAQIMNLGTYDDIRRLEAEVDPVHFVDAMLSAQPGWFSGRSWEFWRGRLSLSSANPIPEMPPRRNIHAAVLRPSV